MALVAVNVTGGCNVLDALNKQNPKAYCTGITITVSMIMLILLLIDVNVLLCMQMYFDYMSLL